MVFVVGRVCLLYGGPSVEHHVSCLSAATILRAFEQMRMDDAPLLVGISRQGEWFLQQTGAAYGVDGGLDIVCDETQRVVLEPRRGLRRGDQILPIDVVMPVIHGAFGEDGGLQTVLQHCAIPYVGADPMASAIGMNKLLSKICWRTNHLPVVDYCIRHASLPDAPSALSQELRTFVRTYGYPLFVKPCRGGSSIGVRKANDEAQLLHAIEHAAQFDDQVLCEQAIVGREIEFAVLEMGDGRVSVSVPGEIVTDQEFYDYDTKYLHTDNATLVIPAQISDSLRLQMEPVIRAAYRAIGCRDLARMDLLLGNDDAYYLNEINTSPGFTAQSMFPALWEGSGHPLPEVLSLLINQAIRRGK